MDATCPVMSVGSPRGDIQGRRVSDPRRRRTTRTCWRLARACTARPRLKHLAERAPRSSGLAAASPRGRLAVNGSTAGRNPSPSASGLRGSADSHLPRSAAARFGAVRGMHVAVLVTAIVLVAVTAALALAPQLHLGYPQEAVDLALDTAASVIGLLACFLVFGRASPPHPAERAPAGRCARGTCAIQPVPVHGAGRSGLGTR